MLTVRTLSIIGALALAPAAFAQPVVVPDNGFGTADLPPPAPHAYDNVGGTWHAINGFPSGWQLNMDATLGNFNSVIRTPDGFGGENQSWQATMTFAITGTGGFGAYNRTVNMAVIGQSHTGPRGVGSTQNFTNDLLQLQGPLPPGDPAFDLRRITAGGNFGLPSPGASTLTQSGPNWNVYSIWHTTWRVDLIGHSPSLFGGMSGSTTGQVDMEMGVPTPGAAGALALGTILATRRRRA